MQTVIITGANSGLGYKCALNIAASRTDYHVLLACRNSDRAEEALKKLKTQTHSPNISTLPLNASFASIREFPNALENANLPPLYGLKCNAAPNSRDHQAVTDDGFEITFGVCHLGHFLLTSLLLPNLEENGRIVFVASDMHDPPKVFGKVSYLGAQALAYPQKDRGCSVTL
jgi:NAD(P)-dependent dehydrogenase (short-subunit alcohol dehydrogenase family)